MAEGTSETIRREAVEAKPSRTHPAVTLTRITTFRDGGILTKYFYTGIRVRDLERSIQFYRKVMGMKVTRRGQMHHGGVWVELKSPDSPQRLELNWYPSESKHFTPYRRGEELDHLAFRVSDVKHAFKEIVAKGARPEIEPFREDRYEFAFASDPDGIWIELLGRIKA